MAGVSLWLYRTMIAGLVPVAVPVLKIKDLLAGKSRPSFRERLALRLPNLPKGGMWLQAVSVGEVELARRLVAELRRVAPEVPIVVSATTATGLGLARKTLEKNVSVIACPLDLPGPVKRVLEAADPRLMVLVETELWPELLYQAGRRGVPVAVINARLSKGSFTKYHRVTALLRPLLAPLRLVLARSDSDGRRFSALGVAPDRIQVSGNVKYDLEVDRRPLEWASAVTQVAGERPIVVAGSTMDGEEIQVLDAVGRLQEQGKSIFLILAPRHPERFDAVARLLQERGLKFALRSASGVIPDETEVFLIDTIGELARAYGLAALAFIGGSLAPTGGHNPLEPAVWGVPVLSGPHVHNFQEVYDEMTASGGARLIADSRELGEAIETWLDDQNLAATAGEAAEAAVLDNRGATARTVQALLELAKET